MYHKFFIVFFSLFLLILSTFIKHIKGHFGQTARASGVCEETLTPISTGGFYDALVKVQSHCRKQ